MWVVRNAVHGHMDVIDMHTVRTMSACIDSHTTQSHTEAAFWNAEGEGLYT